MSTGDNFTKMNYPCVLFEAGHFPNDYERNETRKYNALALISGLFAIATKDEFAYSEYESIPQNGQKFLDLILRNVKVSSIGNESLVDLGIYYEDVYQADLNNVLEKGIIQEVGDLRKFIGHIDLDVNGATFKSNLVAYPNIGQLATFSVGELKIENGRIIR